MKLRLLLACLILGFIFCNSVTKAQNSGFSKFLNSGDSLIGFDEELAKQQALQEGLFGDSFKNYIASQKRSFINSKYDLWEYVEDNSQSYFPGVSGKLIGGGSSVNNAPCVNEDFETGNLNGWTGSRGQNTSSQVYPTFTTNITIGTQATVVTTPLTDPFVGSISSSPLGGLNVARINNTVTGTAAAIRVSQTFSITATNYLFDFAYWAVMEDAVNHNCTATPYMAVRIRNFTGTLQACPNFSIVAPSSGVGGCAGIGPTTWTTLTVGPRVIKTNLGWQKFSIDLTPYMGQNVTVEAIVAHCSQTGHFGYAYFDARCNTMNLTVNNTTTLSMPTATITPTVMCASTATLAAPAGLNPYQWFGPTGSGINGTTAGTITTSVAGNYTLNMSPTGICNPPIQKIISLSFVPPTTITTSPATICAAGTNTSSTLTASGALNYTWQPGGSNAASIVVSPTITTIYTLTARSGSCIGTFTREITVSPDPVITVSSSGSGGCASSSMTLSAIGANTYTWYPGNLSGGTVVVNPTSTTIYTVVGLTSGGCSGSNTIQVTVNSTPTVQAFNITNPTSSVCVGVPVTLVATSSPGANTYSWFPSGVTGPVVSVTPSVTTIYTVIGAIGTCTGSATITVLIDPGPTMTVSASPTITCPGVNATLTAFAPSSLGFTWTPGSSTSSTQVVSPTVTTSYSVTGINSAGCRSTYTISKLVAPNPTIIIAPSSPTVCNGSAITLTASGGISYTWSPGGSTGALLSVNPSSNTSYTATGTNGTCTSLASTIVTVVPLPSITAAVSPTAVCFGNSATLSGNGGTSYTWQPGNLTGANVVVTPAANTTYTVVGTSGSCTNTATVSLVVNPRPVIIVSASANSVCPGICTTLTPSGAQTYTYLNGGPVVCPLSGTTFSVSGTSSLGCTSTSPGTINIGINPVPAIVLSASSSSICNGGSATITATGANSYTWQPGNMNGGSAVVSPTVTTTYTVSGTNSSGCTGQNTITIIVVPNPTVSASSNPTAICIGQSAVLTGNGASNYTWSPGGMTGVTANVSPLSTTVYTVTGNTSGCTGTGTVAVVVNPNPTISVSASTPTVCVGGSVSFTATGANTYTWLPGNMNGPVVSANPTVTTTYTVNGQSSAGCAGTQTISVTVIPTASISASASPTAICIGASATLTAIGATSYTWSPGSLNGSSIVVNPTVTTSYTVTGTSSGCPANPASITLIVNPNPTVNASASPTSVCSGVAATLTATGANSYTWNPGNLTGSSVVVTRTATTTFTVVGSSLGCTNTKTVTLVINNGPTLSMNAFPPSVCSGSCSVLTSTSTTSLGYTWNPGGMNGSTVSVCPTVPTVYSVTGINSLGCTTTRTVNININPTPTISIISSTTTVCSGGTVGLIATGGSGSNYTWTPGPVLGAFVTMTPAATTIYTVVGANASGCRGQNTININVIPTPTITASASPSALCTGGCSTLSATGASNYTWNPGATTGASVSVCPTVTTTYTLTGMTGACSGNTNQITVTVNPLPVVSASASPATICSGQSSTLSASGASTYTWQPVNLSGSSITVTPVTTTAYTVNATSAAGCTASAVTMVTVNPTPTVNVTASSTSVCAGGNVTLTATGANNYTWMPGSLSGSQVSVSPTVTTTYTVNGATSGCSDSKTITIIVVPVPTVNVAASSTVICSGGCATLTASGATSYTWSTGSNANPIVVCPTAPTLYTLAGRSGGCTGFTTVIVLVNPNPTITTNGPTTGVCAGSNATLTASGASTYTWNPGGMTGSLVVVTPPTSTVYTVTGTSVGGCTASATRIVSVNPVPNVSISVNPSATLCAGSTATLTGSGATSYTWNPSSGPSSSSSTMAISPTITTVYTLTGSNGFGCRGIQTITITVLPLPSISASASSLSLCAGSCSTLTANGGSSYTWTPVNATGSSIVVCPTVSTTYTVRGTNGTCSNTATLSISVNTVPVIFAVASPTNICAGSNASLAAGGASNYTWNPGGMIGSTVVVSPGTSTVYTVIGANSSGCSGTATVAVSVTPLPTLSITATPTAICPAQVATLTATGATNYTWSPGGLTVASITVNPVTTTTYTLTGENSGCSSVITKVLTVNPAPAITATASPASICIGFSSTLTAFGAGSYTWDPGSIGGSPVVVTPTSTTIYTVTGSNGSGCSGTQTVQVTVNTSPSVSVTASSGTICSGASATLTASGTLAYTWSPGGSTNTVIVVNPASTTVYTLTGSNGSGCTGSTTFTLNVTPTPTITATAANASVCAGFTTALLASGATSYTWEPGTITNNPATVTPIGTTVYTVTGGSGACVSTATVMVTVVPLPTVSAVASPSNVCSGGTTTLTASGLISYTWLPMFTSGATVTDTPSSSTTYTVGGFGANGCPNYTTVSVNVLTPPNITITPSTPSVCTGSSATLTASGAVNYTWSVGSVTGSTLLINPTVPTTYSVIGDNGACTGTASITMNINPLPSISASANPTVVCGGGLVTLTGAGGVTYTWNPMGTSGTTVTDNPTISVTYTVTGEDANGCKNTANVTVSVNPSPTLVATPSPTSVCFGGSITITASGALTYTWLPSNQTSTVITDTPTATTVYTLTGTDIIGCIGTGTVQVPVFPTPTLNVSPVSSSICAGSSATLTATGATSYTWLPGSTNSSVNIVSPTANTTYTVIGDNGGICFDTFTVNVFVNPLPANLTATCNGTITCASPTVNLMGSSSSTNVSYSWSGPQSFTSSVQNPTAVSVWGTFTLYVTDNITGCVASVTVDVPTDNSIPLVTATSSGSITCSSNTVTLNAVHTTTNPGYSWSGPSSFTSAAQTVTVSNAGTYTVVVTDLTSNCTASAVVTVNTHTTVLVNATITPATCTAGVSNNNGTIKVDNFIAGDRFDLVAGGSYTGSATYTSAINIPTTGILTSNLANPTNTVNYTVRIFDAQGCVKDIVLTLIPIDCSLRSIGLAKNVKTPVTNNDGTYDVTYEVIAKNYDVNPISSVVLTENLSSTFPSPASFTVVGAPVLSSGGGLTLNTSFNGSSQTALTTTASVMSGSRTDTIRFTVRVNVNGVFGPYSNTVSAVALNSVNVSVSDVSTDGTNPDPDSDGNPKNNNVPTVITFSPDIFFGLTKKGSFVKLDNNSFDVTYTITVHNLGNDTLRNIVVKDSLYEKTIRQPASYTIKTKPVTDGYLVDNVNFNGRTDINLINSDESFLPPGVTSSIVFVINVVPDTVTYLSNSATGSARSVAGGNNVSDISNNGNNPDSNDNGVWNEPEDNVPTVLILPGLTTPVTHTLFIPEGFSPDGDGINDVFEIKGLPTDGVNSITIYNRWGNRVYYHENYNNSWQGYPNIAGTFGKDKLPQGTYYYVLEMKGSAGKAITGFIVLQY